MPDSVGHQQLLVTDNELLRHADTRSGKPSQSVWQTSLKSWRRRLKPQTQSWKFCRAWVTLKHSFHHKLPGAPTGPSEPTDKEFYYGFYRILRVFRSSSLYFTVYLLQLVQSINSTDPQQKELCINWWSSRYLEVTIVFILINVLQIEVKTKVVLN